MASVIVVGLRWDLTHLKYTSATKDSENDMDVPDFEEWGGVMGGGGFAGILQELEEDDENDMPHDFERSFGSQFLSEVKEELEQKIQGYMVSHVAPTIRSKLQT
jgi:hypothetical protein